MGIIIIFRRNRWFFSCALLFLFVGAWFLFTNHKGDETIWMNGHRTPVADIFFFYLTNLGLGWSFVIAASISLFIRFSYAWMFALAGIFTAIVSGVMKNIVFMDAPRPPKFFEGKYSLHFIDGVRVDYLHSFPSGHTMCAFAIAGVIALINRKWLPGIFALGIALLVGISRIYLLKHFFEDVYASAFIGIAIAIFVVFLVEKKSKKAPWINRNISGKQ